MISCYGGRVSMEGKWIPPLMNYLHTLCQEEAQGGSIPLTIP